MAESLESKGPFLSLEVVLELEWNIETVEAALAARR